MPSLERYAVVLSDPEVRRIGLYINNLAAIMSRLILSDPSQPWTTIVAGLLKLKEKDAQLLRRLDERALAHNEECIGRLVEDIQRITVDAISILQVARRCAAACQFLGACIQHHHAPAAVESWPELGSQSQAKSKLH